MATPRRQYAVTFRPSSEIRNRLRLGTVVRAVVVQPLAHDTAIISVRGVNTIAVSALPLARGQVLYAEVADVGEKVHLRIVPAPLTGRACRTTTAAELARHLAEIGIEPTETAIGLAAAMLSAELPVTPASFADVARLVHDAGRDDAATTAAAAWVVRHERAGQPKAVDAVRAALFEPPCLGERLEALDTALASTTDGAARHGALAQATRSLMHRVRTGRPLDWLQVAFELGGAQPGSPDPAAPDWTGMLAHAAADAPRALAETAERLLEAITGVRLVCGAASTPGEVRWPLQVPFVNGDALGTAFVEIAAPAGEFRPRGLPARCTVNGWAPLAETALVSCELRIRDGRARGRLIVAGSEAPEAYSVPAARWLEHVLAQAGIRLGDLDAKTAGTLDIGPAADQPVPAVGLDFRI